MVGDHPGARRRARASRAGRAAAVAVLCALLPTPALAETLGELVAREQGVALGVCGLVPPEPLAGQAVHAVVPAQFETAGLWTTRTLLLVGVDANGVVQGQTALTLDEPIAPRAVVSLRCGTDRIEVRLPDGTRTYERVGHRLQRIRPKH